MSLTLYLRLPASSLSLTLAACRESEKGQNLAVYSSLSVSPATLWASLDIRESARTGVRGNPAATRGVDRDDDDDDKLPAGKALRSTADVGDGRVGDESLEDRRREEVREGETGGRGGCVARRSGRGRESTNEETNALRSTEHACSSTRECCKGEQRQND